MFSAMKKTAASATAIAIVAMVGVTSAPAFAAGPNDGRNWRQGQQHDGGRNVQRNRHDNDRRAERRRDHRPVNRRAHSHRRDNTNAAIVGGILGLGAASVIGSALSNKAHARPAASPRPWTNDWYAYCGSKYRSFNPRTGYYLSYSGNHVFCR